MDAVKKAASGAVDSIRNSPMFKRKFGTRHTPTTSPSSARKGPGNISPERDTTPFVQGIYFQVDYLGKKPVDSYEAQDHGCTDEAVTLLWTTSSSSPVAKHVSVKISTTSVRVKELTASADKDALGSEEEANAKEGSGAILYEFPLFRISYCGTNSVIPEAFSFVAKDADGQFYSYVFRCANMEKSYALALTVAKAFYLAYQILLEQQGNFPAGPERELLFEPQRSDDTREHQQRPVITADTLSPSSKSQVHVQLDLTDVSPESPSSIPSLRVVRPSMTSADSETLTLASADEDFARMAKARSNPDILRSTLEADDIKGGEIGWAETLRRHADPGSQVPTPFGSSEQLNNLNDIS